MSTLVVDASIAVKWVVQEAGTPKALALRKQGRLAAPDLLMAECANILWKKHQRQELTASEVQCAARLLQAAEIELRSTRPLLAKAANMACRLHHPAYDCVYLALAVEMETHFVTADQRFLRTIASHPNPWRGRAVALMDASGRLD